MKKPIMLMMAMILMAFSLQAASPVKWKAEVKMTSATAGVVTLTAQIEDGWHVYGTKMPEDGPSATKLYYGSKGVKFTSNPKCSPAPKKEVDDMFGMELTYWSNKVTFTRAFEVLDPNGASVTVKVNYMCCNDSNCRPPQTEEFTVPVK